jgi:predicted amidohydrolase YtcJ
MSSINRRSFIASAGLALAGAGVTRFARGALAGISELVPDSIVVNARVHTVDAKQPTAQAFAVKAGRFIAVGSNEDIRKLAGVGTKIFDAAQMTVVPGFNDSHNHAPGDVLLYEVLVGNPYEVEFVTIESIVTKLKARVAGTPKDTWVDGYFFDDTKIVGNRPLTREDLDAVSKDLPVKVVHRGGHTAYYNSRAFALAGVTRDTPDPTGGTFDHNAKGELSGSGA